MRVFDLIICMVGLLAIASVCCQYWTLTQVLLHILAYIVKEHNSLQPKNASEVTLLAAGWSSL